MAGNSNLNNSARNKQDEFYTQLSQIEDELKHYKEHFRDKIILCNCDDPYESNFFKYFCLHFRSLGIKKLIATGYVSSPIIGTEIDIWSEEEKLLHVDSRTPYVVYINDIPDLNQDGRTDLEDVKLILKQKHNCRRKLHGDKKYLAGDFRSEECVKLLKQADIVVTNPPFSLFREYVAQLVDYNKKFVIIGNLNAIKYKDILPLFMTDQIWLGHNSGHYWFRVPSSYEEKKTDFKIDESGQKWRRMGNIAWFTNLDIRRRHEELILHKHYSPELYPKYDNYNAIEVNKTVDIPCDYYKQIGVPITFMTKHNPNQFEILGVLNSGSGNKYDFAKAEINGKQLYARILIRRKMVK